MFLDASAVVAIMTAEEGADLLVAKIAASKQQIHYSSITVFEAVIAISRKAAVARYGDQKPTSPHLIASAQTNVGRFMRSIGATEIDLPAGIHESALTAASTFGRFVGHPAKLNFGDCFTYAAAKTLKSPLLFVGEDFAQTDIEPA